MCKIPQFPADACQGCGAEKVEPFEIGKQGKIVKNMCPRCKQKYEFVEDNYGDALRQAVRGEPTSACV